MVEHRKRSIIKAACWRVIATSTTMILVFIFTGEVLISIGVGFVEVISKIIFYYFHERIWDKISWGKSYV